LCRIDFHWVTTTATIHYSTSQLLIFEGQLLYPLLIAVVLAILPFPLLLHLLDLNQVPIHHPRPYHHQPEDDDGRYSKSKPKSRKPEGSRDRVPKASLDIQGGDRQPSEENKRFPFRKFPPDRQQWWQYYHHNHLLF